MGFRLKFSPTNQSSDTKKFAMDGIIHLPGRFPWRFRPGPVMIFHRFFPIKIPHLQALRHALLRAELRLKALRQRKAERPRAEDGGHRGFWAERWGTDGKPTMDGWFRDDLGLVLAYLIHLTHLPHGIYNSSNRIRKIICV